ncbi:MAG TPA: helix-turn-helix domain-containing protein [Acidimicrobiia bacterium]|jgi:AraC-like DNA-binding protein|nr:helix-turn-helix domain-containing protein [Acidimicrobiia bacterium]
MILREAGVVLNESDIYWEWAPPEAWREVVACCWEQRVHADRVQRVLPDGHADVLLFGSGAVELVGVYDHVALPVLPRGTLIRGIRLRPEAIASAFRLEASELRNVTVPAEDVMGPRDARRLRDSHAVDAWIRSITPDRRTAAAIELLQSESVEGAARQLGISPRQLQRDMVANVGLTPKVLQRVMRMQRFLDLAGHRGELAAASADAGYADQSHLTREVRALSGLTPARLLADRARPTRSN